MYHEQDERLQQVSPGVEDIRPAGALTIISAAAMTRRAITNKLPLRLNVYRRQLIIAGNNLWMRRRMNSNY